MKEANLTMATTLFIACVRTYNNMTAKETIHIIWLNNDDKE